MKNLASVSYSPLSHSEETGDIWGKFKSWSKATY